MKNKPEPPKFILKSGHIIQYESPFEYERKNMGKFTLCFSRDEIRESPWCLFHQDGVQGDYGLLVTANSCISGPPWGAILPYRIENNQKLCVIEELINIKEDVIVDEFAVERGYLYHERD